MISSSVYCLTHTDAYTLCHTHTHTHTHTPQHKQQQRTHTHTHTHAHTHTQASPKRVEAVRPTDTRKVSVHSNWHAHARWHFKLYTCSPLTEKVNSFFSVLIHSVSYRTRVGARSVRERQTPVPCYSVADTNHANLLNTGMCLDRVFDWMASHPTPELAGFHECTERAILVEHHCSVRVCGDAFVSRRVGGSSWWPYRPIIVSNLRDIILFGIWTPRCAS